MIIWVDYFVLWNLMGKYLKMVSESVEVYVTGFLGLVSDVQYEIPLLGGTWPICFRGGPRFRGGPKI